MPYERRKHWIIYFAQGDEELFPRIKVPHNLLANAPAVHAFAKASAPQNATRFYVTKSANPAARTGNIKVEGPIPCR